MKSRAIALGASVLALALAGGGQAAASDLDRLGKDLTVQTETKASSPAGSATVEGDVKVPVAAPVEGVARKPGRPSATVEAERKSGDDRSEVVLTWDGRTGVSAYADQRRKGEHEVEAWGKTSPGRADATATGFARNKGKARVDGSAGVPKATQAQRGERSVREHSRALAGAGRHAGDGRESPLAPLRAIGREVGNPVQLSLAGWLIALTAAAGFGASRLVRRLQRSS